jgi:hypothetical protein
VGYNVSVSGTVWLSQADEARLVPLLRDDMLDAEGWLDSDEPVANLNDLATFAGASCWRERDQVHFADDREGDPKWSEQATAFYLGLGHVVVRGEIRVRGEDDETWRYTYTPEGPVQHGLNGWDGSTTLTGGDEGQDEHEVQVTEGLEEGGDTEAESDLRVRIRRYTLFGALPAAGGGMMLAAGNNAGALPLVLGALNLAVAAQLRRRLHE